ncbi:uncharacterized protein LOC109818409 isoform X3 [Cajanus cajan]|uniref:uncharacterized protein LOC109818409 isoform X3 n=1 Tax=Cajanus cajan TaxID=3821 RepID=UPI00098D7D96|nr:uncharacterized protein LOC109818409 isoform X3 [Cajanus cajan]
MAPSCTRTSTTHTHFFLSSKIPLILVRNKQHQPFEQDRKKKKMSLPRPSEDKAPSQLKEGVAAAASSSSSWNRLHTFPPLTLQNKSSKIEDSDEDMFTVPDVEATPTSVHSAVTLPNSNLNQHNNVTDPQFQTGFAGKRRRGRNPADKEHRRLKRDDQLDKIGELRSLGTVAVPSGDDICKRDSDVKVVAKQSLCSTSPRKKEGLCE